MNHGHDLGAYMPLAIAPPIRTNRFVEQIKLAF
jgi:hypothetical protein